MGLEIPKEPPSDYLVAQIIYVYAMASRARRYEQGEPLPLTVRDINDVLKAHFVAIDRETLDGGVFAIDDEWLNEIAKEREK